MFYLLNGIKHLKTILTFLGPYPYITSTGLFTFRKYWGPLDIVTELSLHQARHLEAKNVDYIKSLE